ncbi:hypothetical protein [Nocardia farcinica]|uniref:3'-5' exonuclease n=1 Tax=Nocardia farcinica TaxID=37329 RepID=UPI002456CEE1|nr:hypothetical protein [Nocardia farcinica]
MSTPIVFLDTETTGLHADRRPWEIAMIRREGDRQRSLTIYVSDVDLSSAELIGLRVGGFHDRHPMYRKEAGGAFDIDTESDDTVDPWAADDQLGIDHCLHLEQHAAAVVERWTRGAHIVGAVPNFDTECLSAMLRRHGLCPAWHHHLIDVEALAVGYLHGSRQVGRVSLPWKSDAVSTFLGVKPPSEDERHTAMGDARWAMRLYDHITGGSQ